MTYYEPFLGAGSIFFTYRPPKAILSDLNHALIHTFTAVKNHPSRVADYLEELTRCDNEETYYSVRSEYNQCKRPACLRQAARFIYLNKTCFNGIFRVNTRDDFNVPYGHKKKPAIPTLDDLKKVSRALQVAELFSEDYRHVLTRARKEDFVYLDPPYPPLNGSSYFTHYTKQRFSEQDQVGVFEFAEELSSRGCFVLITNADTKGIRDLYHRWRLHEVERTRWITSSKHKHKVGELIIANY